jgi:hypothetical protein
MAIFCDFVHLSQHHPSYVTVKSFTDGLVVKLDGDGEIVFQSEAFKEHVGSHDTKLRIRAWNNKVEMRGNVGRYGRQDNVFGYKFSQVVAKANRILEELGLPVFSAGEPYMRERKSGPPVVVYTGARVSRIDMTENYATGSEQAAGDAIMYFGGIQPTRAMSRAYGKECITYGGESSYTYGKIYDKYQEMITNRKKSPPPAQLLDWVRENGIIRAEWEFQYHFLEQHRINYLGGLMGLRKVDRAESGGVGWLPDGRIQDHVLEGHFRKYTRFMREVRMDIDVKMDLPGHLIGTYFAWREGYDLRERLSVPTFYRHRSALRKLVGIDIAVAYNVKRFPIQVRTVTLSPAVAPDWYALPLAA